MKILLVSPGWPPEPGGVEAHVEATASGLVALGHRVTVLALSNSEAAADQGKKVPGVTVVRHPARSVGPFQLPLGLSRRLRALAATHDVVHAHNYHSPLPILALRAVRDRPVVVSPHYHGGGHSLVASLVHPLYRRAFAALQPRAAALVFVSAAEQTRFTEDFEPGPPTWVIHNGIRRPAPAGGPRDRTVVSVGRLEPYKRVDVLIAAFAELGATDPDARCVVVGDGPDRARLEALATAAGPEVGPRITFTGRIGDAELDSLLARARVAVAPSAHEAFGMAALDALAAGLTVIASDIPAHRELAGLSGGAIELWAPTDGVGALREAIGRALDRSGRPVTGLPTWADASAALEAVYEHVKPTQGAHR